MSAILRRLAALAVLLAAGGVAADAIPPYWADRWRGWHFYEDPGPEPTPLPAPLPAPHSASPAPGAPARAPELAAFAHLQKHLEESRTIAIMRPTEANVRHYLELEAQVVAQASRFADVAQQVAWAHPELDPTVQGRPVNAKALEVFEGAQAAERARAVGELARDHVLFFFYRSDCPYCHAFAPILAGLTARHGLQVVAVSLDGGPMPGFPLARPDNGIATALKVTQVPAVFLAQPYTGQITPVGFGLLSEAQLLERLAIAARPATDARPPEFALSPAHTPEAP